MLYSCCYIEHLNYRRGGLYESDHCCGAVVCWQLIRIFSDLSVLQGLLSRKCVGPFIVSSLNPS